MAPSPRVGGRTETNGNNPSAYQGSQKTSPLVYYDTPSRQVVLGAVNRGPFGIRACPNHDVKGIGSTTFEIAIDLIPDGAAEATSGKFWHFDLPV